MSLQKLRTFVLSLLMLAPAAAMPVAGCDQFAEHFPGSAQELAPDVDVSALQLRRQPSLEQLGAYYCPRVIGDPFIALGCNVLGAQPAKSQLAFEFGIVLTVHNPNDFPVPALDVLLGLTLFEGVNAESLGAICVSMCGTDDPSCDGSPRPGACEAQQNDIRTLGDFVSQIPNLISDLATGRAVDELRKSTILAGGDITLDLDFVLGIDQALSVFEKTALSYVEDLMAGRDGDLSVPVAAEGTVFVRLPALGRLGVGFGPLRDTWRVY